MEEKRILKMRKMGCDFYANEYPKSDIRNHRVRVVEDIELKDGRMMFFEFRVWEKYIWRYHNKKTGTPLKKPIKELFNNCALAIDTRYENEKGCWRDSTIEKAVYSLGFDYKKSSILTIINMFSKIKYDYIEFIN